ncbi:hypothetical protein EMIT047CA2_60133 [Pseudomonas soli]
MAVQSARLSTGIGKPLVLLNEYLTALIYGKEPSVWLSYRNHPDRSHCLQYCSFLYKL